jgi:hypothetical protein
VQIYPNPTQLILNFEYTSTLSDVKVKVAVFDVVGRFVKSVDKTLNLGKNLIRLDVKGLADGTYTIKYYNHGNGVHGSLKFIKESH